jgi:lipoprotein-anchoring transpeptidase ErfK/SrfK
MPQVSRRAILVGSGASLLGTSFGGCVPQQPVGASVGPVAAVGTAGPVPGERFPLPAAPSGINPAFLRTRVAYAGSEKPGTIVIDPGARYLYFVEEGGRAIRYGVGVGKEGFAWSGTATIHDKQEWPDWYPPKEMIQRRPDIRSQLSELKVASASLVGRPIRSGRAPCTFGKATRTRSIESTAPTSLGPSARTCRPAASG